MNDENDCACVWCLQCFDAGDWAAGRASGLQKTQWWDAGMVMCLGLGADLHMAQLMPMPLTISCSRNPDWFYFPGFTLMMPDHPAGPRQNPTGP